MGKNRIKNLRDITVGGKSYKWMVDWSGIENDEKRLRVWEDKNTVIHESMLKVDSVTPADVADIIESVVVNG